MKNALVILISLCFSLISCEDRENITKTNPIVDSALTVVWKKPIGYSALGHYTGLFNDKVIFSINESTLSFYDELIALDKTSGKEIWKSSQHYWIPSNFYQKNNVLYFESAGEIIAIDMNTGFEIWHIKCPYTKNANGTLGFIGNKLCYNWSCGDKIKVDSTLVYFIDADNGKLTKIHTWQTSDNDFYQLVFFKPELWMHPSGDSILILTSNSNNWSTSKTKPDIICWNLSKETIYKESKGHPGFTSIGYPLVIGNNLFVKDFKNVQSIDLIDFNSNWLSILPYENQTNGQLMYHSSSIITQLSTNRDAITWIDPQKGKINHTLANAGAVFRGYTFKDNWLYYIDNDQIKKVDLINPAFVWTFESPSNTSFNTNLELDPATNQIFVSDNNNFYCFENKK